MEDCLFCKIVAGEIPSKKRFENDRILAFDDVSPQAPVHILIIPKKHIVCAADLNFDGENPEDGKILTDIFHCAQKLGQEIPELKDGYRIVNNKGHDGGQTVYHIHFHLLGGRSLSWPPG